MNQSKPLIDWIKDWEKGFTGKVKSLVGSDIITFNKHGMTFETRQMPGIALVCNYELIPKPVDFMTAKQAYSDGKVIICEYHCFPDRMHIVRARICKNPDDGTQSGDALSMYMIETGTWYIED